MAKKHKPAKSDAPPPTAGLLFAFTGHFATKLHFSLVDREPDEPGTPERLMSANFNLGFALSDDKAEVRLGMTINPDRRRKPYTIEVELIGRFTKRQGTIEEFEAFCRLGAPNLLFPYLREQVTRLTSDAPNGPIRLDPVNLAEIIAASGWKGLSESVTSASAHGQPSEQSPDASQD